MSIKSKNITRVVSLVPPEDRWSRQGHQGGVFWFTGLPGSGKATLALNMERRLFDEGYQVRAFRSSDFRDGVSSDLRFSRDDRREHIRRLGEVAALLARRGMVVLTAFISPFQADRDNAREAAAGTFHEIYLDPGLKVCEERDLKGIYAKARAGEIDEFTGISSPYEPPEASELTIDTGAVTVGESLDMLDDYISRAVRLPAA